MKHFLRRTAVMLIALLLLTGCNGKNSVTEQTDGVAADITAEVTVTPDVSSEDVSEASDSSTTADGTADTGESADNSLEVADTEEQTDPNYDPDFKQVYEAEEASFTGNIKVESSKQGFTGTGYLTGMQADSDTITFTVNVPGAGAYDFNFVSAGNTGHKENNVIVDGINVGLSVVDVDDFSDAVLERVYLTSGEHKIMMTKSWGWILLDSLIITASAPADKSIYEVSSELSDPNATDRAKRLMQYLTDVYGKYTISGQYGDFGIVGAEFNLINNQTGKYPAMLGLDFIEYTPSRVANGSSGKDVLYAKKFDQEGGIVTFCWHWNAPEKYLVNTEDKPWWRGFYTDSTTINLAKIMNGEDEEGYDLLLRDIDAIAEQLKILQNADIPILWRPLHEASGGWFWWGASGADVYIKLYQLLYDRLVNYHGIHNLIWVWNGQNKAWYPGDEYVDIIGYDSYPGERVYTSQVGKFSEMADWLGKTKKMITMSENGCLVDPELAARDNAMWLYFGTWEGEFTITEKYTEFEMMKKVYNSDKVITLDELPDLKIYGN
jgi:mannan endo-1,4-beta-mannosidase